MSWLALDIGGANLKFADGNGYAQSYPFAMWERHDHLGQELRTLIAEAPASDHLAVTMTGELADCFESKSAGVRFILQAVREASDGRHTRVYLSDGRMVTPQVAANLPLLTAASNWHVLARFVGRYASNGPALLIDIGSTTCDIVPLANGKPAASAVSDTDRLLSGMLVYTGVERSPVCALVDAVPYRGKQCPLAQELFATAVDAHVMLGNLPEMPSKTTTADGRPATKIHCCRRLGRMICADDEHFNMQDAMAMAETIVTAQVGQIAAAVKRVADKSKVEPTTIVISGQGEFLARKVIAASDMTGTVVSVAEKLGADVSQCAPAHALAIVAREAVEG